MTMMPRVADPADPADVFERAGGLLMTARSQRGRIGLATVGLASALLVSACAYEGTQRPGRPMDKVPLKGCDTRDSDTPPVLLEGDAPIYPAEDKWSGKQGSATVTFVVNADGSTTIVQATSEEDKYFAGHTALAIRDWRFKPAIRDGRPVAIHCTITMNFSKTL